MDPKMGIRIEGPEEEPVSSVVTAVAVLAMILSLFALYILFIEFFGLEPDPLVRSLLGLA